MLFWVNRCVFPLSGLVRAFLILLSYCLSIRLFCYVLLVAIFLSKIVWFFLHPVIGLISCHLLPLVGRIFFRCFGMSCFVCIVLPFVDISLITLLLPLLSGLFPQGVLLFFLVLPFPFCLYTFQHLLFVLSSRPVFVDFFICVSSWITHPDFVFFFVRGSQFSHKLISPLHRLIHLIRLYYWLIYEIVQDLFHSFPS